MARKWCSPPNACGQNARRTRMYTRRYRNPTYFVQMDANLRYDALYSLEFPKFSKEIVLPLWHVNCHQ